MKLLPQTCLRRILTCLLVFFLAKSALATPPALTVPSELETTQPSQTKTNAATTLTGFFAGINRSSYLLGDMWGLRTLLSQYGMSFALSGNQRGARQCIRRRQARLRL